MAVALPETKDNAIIKSGSLFYRHPTHRIKKIKKHYMTLFGKSTTGLPRLEIYENEKDYRNRSYSVLVPGSDVVSVRECHRANASANEKYGFFVSTKEHQHYFCTNNKEELSSWHQKTVLTFLSQGDGMQDQEIIENDVYESAEQFTKEFHVKAGEETRQKLGVDGKLRLVVENKHITIVTMDGNRIARWGIEHLRRFGYKGDDFHLEAGRKSEHGPGIFNFYTLQGKQIHATVTQEKRQFWKGKNSGAGGKPKINPGHIDAEPDECEIPFTAGIGYENVVIYSECSGPRQAPEKPPRAQHMRPNADTATANSYHTLVIGGSDAHERRERGGEGGGAEISLNNMKSMKSQPTVLPVGGKEVASESKRDSSEFRPAREVLPNMVTKVPNVPLPPLPGQIYSEPMIIIDAWKTHGRDEPVYENTVAESDYDSLNFNGSKQIKVSEESPYGTINKRPPAPGVIFERNQALARREPDATNVTGAEAPTHVTPSSVPVVTTDPAPAIKKSEPIYAEVIKPNKKLK